MIKMNLLCFEFNKINKINDKPNYSSKKRRIKIECVHFDQNMTGLYNLDIDPHDQDIHKEYMELNR